MADFVLGRIKFVWKGAWVTSTAFTVDDVVKYGGKAFVCKTNHTSGTFETDLTATKWEEMVGGTEWKGAHANSTAYKVNDLVKHGASVFICTVAHTSSSAVLDTTKFTTYVGGVEFEDTYAAGTAYQIGDIVQYGGYSYVNVQAATGQTPYNNTGYWKVMTTGYSMQGTWSNATAYKTGDVVLYGGNTYVFKVDTSLGQVPTNSSYADQLVQGISLRGDWTAGNVYLIGETVIYQNSTYRAKQDVAAGVIPTTLGVNWSLYTQGDPAGVLSTQGDMIVQGSVSAETLPIGRPGTKIVVDPDGTGLLYAKEETGNKWHVSTEGSDSNPGTLELPFKSVKHAALQCTTYGIGQIGVASGGTGGTPGVYKNVEVSGGSSTGTTATVTTDGSSAPEITIDKNGSNWTEGNTGTISKNQVGDPSADITFTVETVNIGDEIAVHQGTYEEQFPIILPEGTVMTGDSLRGSRVEPAAGASTEVLTVNTIGANHASRAPGTYNRVVTTTRRMTSGTVTTSAAHNYTAGDLIQLEDIIVSCPKTDSSPGGTKTYPVRSNVTAFTVLASNLTSTTFDVTLGVSGVPQSYVSGGTVVKSGGTRLDITGFDYNINTGIATITTATHGLSASDTVNLFSIKTSCKYGVKVYPQIPFPGIYPVTSVVDSTNYKFFLPPSNIDHTFVSGGTSKSCTCSDVGSATNITNFVYDNTTGLTTVTSASHGLAIGDAVEIENVAMSCNLGTKTYPDSTVCCKIFYVYDVIDANNFIFGTDKSNLQHTYVSGGTSQKVSIANSNTQTITNFVYDRDAKGKGSGLKCNVIIDGSSTIVITPKYGGANYEVGDEIIIADSVLGSGGAPGLTCKVATVQDNNKTTMFLLNEKNNVRQMTFTGMTTGANIMALDPSGAITLTSPYIQNCTSINDGTTGLLIDGNAQASGYRSMLANDFTQVNSDGTGVHAMNRARAELVSVFTYYCGKGYHAETGAILRCCNCCNAYGEYGAYAQGTDPTETPVSVNSRGQEITHETALTTIVVGDSLTGATSGATATVIGAVNSTKKAQIDSVTGRFSRGEVVNATGSASYSFTLDDAGGRHRSAITITGVTQANPGVVTSASHGLSNGNEVTIKDVVGMTQLNGNKYFVKSVATNTFELASTVGGTNVDTSGFTAYSSAGSAIPTDATSGQTGFLIRVDSSDGTLGTAGKIKVGSNIQFNSTAMPDAAALLTANKEFLKDEVMSYFDATYPGAHTSDRHVKCERDVGYSIDSLIYDLTNDTADRTKEYAETYWVGAASQLANTTEQAYAVAVYTKLEEIIRTKILVNSAWTTLQSPVVTTQSYTASDGETGSTQRCAELIDVYKDVVQNGLEVIPVGNAGINYAVTAVTDEDTSNQRATVKIGTERTYSIYDNTATKNRNNYSNIRLTGHDFLHIGTGSFADTNYPNNVGVTQPADQSRETTELTGGRVYFVSTDQSGNFRVGPQFRVDQATGTATLNADAFDLSGLTQLQLGSIGAQIGAMINEFSTDGTLAGNSDTAVPTEQATKTYVDTNIASPPSTIITGQTAESTAATDDVILIYDTSATALRKMTRSDFTTGLGGISMGKAIAAAIVFG